MIVTHFDQEIKSSKVGLDEVVEDSGYRITKIFGIKIRKHTWREYKEIKSSVQKTGY